LRSCRATPSRRDGRVDRRRPRRVRCTTVISRTDAATRANGSQAAMTHSARSSIVSRQ
jgi:hypothetical protein